MREHIWPPGVDTGPDDAILMDNDTKPTTEAASLNRLETETVYI